MAQVVLQCDVAVVRVTNLDVLDLPPGSSHLFVRYYVAIGGGKRIRIDTRKLPCTGDAEEARWDERASLECRPGSSTTANPLKELVLAAGGRSSSTVVFELRCRRSATTVWGKAAAGSRLLGRGEVAWSDAVDSPGMLVETWVRLVTSSTTKKKNQKLKQPAAAALLVRMGVRVEVSETVSASTEKIRGRGRQQWWEDDECRCGSCGWVGSEEDMFLSAATTASMRP